MLLRSPCILDLKSWIGMMVWADKTSTGLFRRPRPSSPCSASGMADFQADSGKSRRRESWDRYPWICSRIIVEFLQAQLRGLGPFLPGNGVPLSTNYIWPSQRASEQGRVQRMPVFFGKYATLCRLWTLQPARVSFLSGSPHASFEKCSCRTWTCSTGTKFSSKGHTLLGSCYTVIGIWGEVFSCLWYAMIGIIFDDNMCTIFDDIFLVLLKLFAASGPFFRSRAFATRASRTTRAADSALNVRFAWHMISKPLEKHDCWDTPIASANNFSLVAPSSNPTRNSSARSSSVPLSLWPCRCQLRTPKEARWIPGPAFIARELGRNCVSRKTTCERVKSNIWSMYFEVCDCWQILALRFIDSSHFFHLQPHDSTMLWFENPLAMLAF